MGKSICGATCISILVKVPIAGFVQSKPEGRKTAIGEGHKLKYSND